MKNTKNNTQEGSKILREEDVKVMSVKKGTPIVEIDPFEKGIKNWLRSKFPMYYAKFQVILETRIYNNESEYIYKQKKGELQRVCEIYLDGEYVCDIGEKDSKINAEKKLFAGLERIRKDRERIADKNVIRT